MAEEKKDDDGSSWAFSTTPSSSRVHDENESGVEPFSAEPTKNWGQRPLSNFGEEPRIDDPAPPRRSIWNVVSWIFNSGARGD